MGVAHLQPEVHVGGINVVFFLPILAEVFSGLGGGGSPGAPVAPIAGASLTPIASVAPIAGASSALSVLCL